MGPRTAGKGAVAVEIAQDRLLGTFACLMRKRYDARIYLFGSRSRGTASADSDYDVVAVAEAFAQQPLLRRAVDRRRLWREAGGWGKGLDLHCYTPAEFREELAGLGYIGQAKRRGELTLVPSRASCSNPS